MKNLNPKNLFLIDGIGALISSFLMGFVLVSYQNFVGIPFNTIYFLATIPFLFAMFDFYVYANYNYRKAHYLKRIASANYLYCILSLSLAFWHSKEITTMGWYYIATEVVIIICLASFEWYISERFKELN